MLLPKFEPDAVFRALPQATVMMGVPTFYTRLLKDPRLDRDTTRHMRVFISGSAPLLPETHREWEARTGHALLERYGMTETNMNASNPYRGARIPGFGRLAFAGCGNPHCRWRRQRVAAGRDRHDRSPWPQCLPRLLADAGKDRKPNSARTVSSSQATWAPSVPTDTLRIVGRGKDLIITGGLNVYPREIESLLDDLPGVEESAVVGLPHDDFGEGVTAFLVLKKDATIREADVLDALRDRLARFKLPKRVIVLDQLPRNTMGKVQKSALRAEYAALYS